MCALGQMIYVQGSLRLVAVLYSNANLQKAAFLFSWLYNAIKQFQKIFSMIMVVIDCINSASFDVEKIDL